ncbi:hypothetical protein CBL_05046 [Carabus blaptoides fortunei]
MNDSLGQQSTTSADVRNIVTEILQSDEFCNQLLALSLIHGGPSPQFFSETVFNYIVSGVDGTKPCYNQIRNTEIRNELRNDGLCELQLAVQNSMYMTIAGFTNITSLDKKATILESLEQFKEGLNILGFLEKLKVFEEFKEMDYLLAHHALREREHLRRRELRFERRHLRDESNPFTLLEVRFVELFHFPQFWVMHLIAILEPHLNIGVRISAIPAYLKVLATLNFYATGSYQRNVGDDYHLAMSQTVISRCVTQITVCIEQHLLPRWVKFPTTNQEMTKIKQT